MAPKQLVKVNGSVPKAEDLVACLIFLGFDSQAVRTAKEIGMDYEGLSNCARRAQDRATDEADFERADRILGVYPEDPARAQQIALGRYHQLMESDEVEDHLKALELAEIKWLGDERIRQAVLKVWEDLSQQPHAQYEHAIKYGLDGNHLLIPGRGIVEDLLDSWQGYGEEGPRAFHLAVELGDQELILSTAQVVCESFIKRGYSEDTEKALAVAQKSGSEELIAQALKARYITLLSEADRVEDLELPETDQLLEKHRVDRNTAREWDVAAFDILMEKGRHRYRVAEFLACKRGRLGKSRQRKAAKAWMQQVLIPEGDHCIPSEEAKELGVALGLGGLVQDPSIQAKLLAYCLHFAERDHPDRIMKITEALGLNEEGISEVVEKLQEHQLRWGDPDRAAAFMKKWKQDPSKFKKLVLKVCSDRLGHSLGPKECFSVRELAERFDILDRVTEKAQAAYLVAREKYKVEEGSYSRKNWIVTAILLAGIFNLFVDPEELVALRQKAYWEFLVDISSETYERELRFEEFQQACPLEQTELVKVGAEVFLHLAQHQKFQRLPVVTSLTNLPEPYGRLAKELSRVEQ